MLALTVDLLLETSSIGLKEIRTNRVHSPAFATERVNRILEDWVEARATEMLLDWFIAHGEELAAALGSQSVVIEVENGTPPQEAPSVEATPHEYWHERKHPANR